MEIQNETGNKDIYLYAYCAGVDQKLESELHKTYKDKNAYLEWYSLGDRDIQNIVIDHHMTEHMKNHMNVHMDNDNDNNNKNNNLNNKNNPPTPLTAGRSDEAGDTVKAVVEYLNQRTGSSYRPGTRSTADKIKARLNEGFTLDDFKVVIDKKAAEWTGTDYEKFLRPETLFGSKFEGYLNQKTKGRTKNKFAALLQEGTL